MNNDMAPQTDDKASIHQSDSRLYNIGYIPKKSAKSFYYNDTYFFPVFWLLGLRSADLKKAKASSTGLLA